MAEILSLCFWEFLNQPLVSWKEDHGHNFKEINLSR